ncbi:MAG: UvrD-helicase domain-containing protein [Phycisphaerae bacterium]
MKLTENQQRAIAHRGADLLLSASAGSGKTEVLARRCVDLIADPHQPCDVTHLAVVTFTRAAAAELRVRLARMLRDAARAVRGVALERHLRRQEVLIATADIGTIDAWCGRLVRENFAAAQVDAGYVVLAPEPAHLLRASVLDELLGWVFTAPDDDAEQARAWLAREARPRDESLRGCVDRINRLREQLIDPDAWLAARERDALRPDTELRAHAGRVVCAAIADECRFQSEQLAALPAARSSPTAAEIADAYAAALRNLEALARGSTDAVRVCAACAQIKLRKPTRAGADVGDLVGTLRDDWLKPRLLKRCDADEVAALLAHAPLAAARLALALRLERRFADRLASAKRRRGVLEFGDVQRAALDLLGTPARTPNAPRAPSPLAEQLRARYEHVLVDEYQDTSPVQVEILRLISRDAPHATNRFLVGDIKQSIYGFRQAEPRLFSRLADAIASGGAPGVVDYLPDNFRSHARLVDGLNALFATLFDRALGGSAYGEPERLAARRDEVANPTLDGTPRVEIHIVPERARGGAADGDDDDVLLERVEREAALAARWIHDQLRAGVQIPERGADQQLALRPLRYSDVVILLRAAVQNAGRVGRVLRDAGIPCVTSGRETILATVEALDLRSVLALLANRRRDLPWAAYLRGPFVGLSEPHLLAIRRAAPNADYCDAVDAVRRCAGPRSTLEDTLDRAVAQLDAWSAAARVVDLPTLLRRILHESAYELFVRALPGGDQRVAVLRAFQRFADEFAATGQSGVAEFVEYLDALEQRELDPTTPVTATTDAVRVLTIHAAKGLEFPFVLLLNAGAAFNRQSQAEPVQFDIDGGLGLRFVDAELRTRVATPEHGLLSWRNQERELGEELRLLYVALTRAREKLLIVGHAPCDAWDRTRERWPAGRPLPLLSRLASRSHLDWLLMAAAARGLAPAAAAPTPTLLHVAVHDGPFDSPPPAPAVEVPAVDASAAPFVWGAADDAWVRDALAGLDASRAAAAAGLPAVLSVSALKQAARRESEADAVATLDHSDEPLALPAFAAPRASPDGRRRGTAVHRFLEHADLGRLETAEQIARQIDELGAARRLAPTDAALLPRDELAWWGATAEARWLAEHAARARRETPFVYLLPIAEASERLLVRGVVDCLVLDEDALTLIDYKTDRVGSDAALAERVAAYSLQMQLYAAATSAIFARPVRAAWLVFLHHRRIVAVPVDSASVQAPIGAAIRRLTER